MAIADTFLAQIRERFAPYGPITTRKMFGGAAVYSNGLLFAIADDGMLFLKVSDTTRPAFAALDLEPFSYPNGETVTVSKNYFRAPEDVWTDDSVLNEWADRALVAARELEAAKPPKKRK